MTRIRTAQDELGRLCVTSVETPRGSIRTRAIVNATGVWAPHVARKCAGVHALHVPMQAMRHAYVVTEKVPGLLEHAHIGSPMRGDHRVHGLPPMPNIRDHDASIVLKVMPDYVTIGGYEPNPIFCEDHEVFIYLHDTIMPF